MNIEQFIKGQSDCRKGVPHEAGKSESYNQGYAAEYALQEIKSNQGERHEIAN